MNSTKTVDMEPTREPCDPAKQLFISQLRPGMRGISTTFIVLEVGPPRQTSQGNEVRILRVADPSGSVLLSLWNEAGSFFKSGDLCRMRNGVTTLYKGGLNLGVGRSGELLKFGEFFMTYSESPDMSVFNEEKNSTLSPTSASPADDREAVADR